MTYFFFFFNDTATTEIYTLSLHDALPISICAALSLALLFPILRALCGVIMPAPPFFHALVRTPPAAGTPATSARSEEHTSELQSQSNLVCRLLLEKQNVHTTAANARVHSP